MGRRVVITGLGPVSNIGTGISSFTKALRRGLCGTRPIKGFDTTGFLKTAGGEVPDFRPYEILRRITPADRGWGRTALFAAAAARLAADDAALDLNGTPAAVVMGTTFGEIPAVVGMAEQWKRNGWGLPDPQAAAQASASNLALVASRELGTVGEPVTLGTACAAGNYALGHAFDLITTGETDIAVAGGADSVNRFTHAGFHRMGALAADVCRPFDVDREGIITGEGGVALVLEERTHAKARGARVYAELLGYGMTCDAKHPVSPDAASIIRCFRLAHSRAGVTPDQVDYICAHGTGTRMNDAVEAAAVRTVFGGKAPPISSIKSMVGHTMGASSGFGAVACALSISEGFLPPTVNHRLTDPEATGLDIVSNQSRDGVVRIAQNNGFAFGGNNAVVMFGSEQ
ncbi:beta-ketoacyl-[acyl-carrier-protein] synthase family protein [Streptomyces sp. NPDC006602]|uniref:beta-ketoacyl-[acyl-carrier-protein] synthase family protein n=1 Tax=Streptomyces sp. NPDC006602 TaxID=3364751 RepID=UPI00367FE829